jgi:hypothetical protein
MSAFDDEQQIKIIKINNLSFSNVEHDEYIYIYIMQRFIKNIKHITKQDYKIVQQYFTNKNINFASCSCYGYVPHDYLKKQHINTNCFVFPDILCETIACTHNHNTVYKLSIDMFNNGFIYSKKIKSHITKTYEPTY